MKLFVVSPSNPSFIRHVNSPGNAARILAKSSENNNFCWDLSHRPEPLKVMTVHFSLFFSWDPPLTSNRPTLQFSFLSRKITKCFQSTHLSLTKTQRNFWRKSEEFLSFFFCTLSYPKVKVWFRKKIILKLDFPFDYLLLKLILIRSTAARILAYNPGFADFCLKPNFWRNLRKCLYHLQ